MGTDSSCFRRRGASNFSRSTIFDRKGQVLKKVGEPALYSQPAFSPDGKRLLVFKEDVKTGQKGPVGSRRRDGETDSDFR